MLKKITLGIIGLSIVIALGMYLYGSQRLVSNSTDTATTTFEGGPSLSESDPVRLSIPKIGVDTHFVRLGLDENKELEVPEGYTEVGWYELGPTPGELGPAVVVGHVDSKTGPAVFYSLGKLEKGDRFTISRADGTQAVFEVDSLERPEQDNFPTQKVYGDIDHAGIRLITCSGKYNAQTQRYDHNLVVYGHLVEVLSDDATETPTQSI